MMSRPSLRLPPGAPSAGSNRRPAHQHVGLEREVLVDQRLRVAAGSRVDAERGRRRVVDGRGGHEADALPGGLRRLHERCAAACRRARRRPPRSRLSRPSTWPRPRRPSRSRTVRAGSWRGGRASPSRNTTSVVANGWLRSTRLEYLPKSHCVGATPSANMMMMFFGCSALRAPGPVAAQPASASATAANPQMQLPAGPPASRRAPGNRCAFESSLMFRSSACKLECAHFPQAGSRTKGSGMHLHILGICGTFMGGIALIARAAGHRVTGCDANVYPPMSDQLAASGHRADRWLERGPDRAPARRLRDRQRVTRGNPLMEEILARGLPYISGPQWLRENVLPGRGCSPSPAPTARRRPLPCWPGSWRTPGSRPVSSSAAFPNNFGVSARLESPAGRREFLRGRSRRVRHRVLRQALEVPALPGAHDDTQQPRVRPRGHLSRSRRDRDAVPSFRAHAAGERADRRERRG